MRPERVLQPEQRMQALGEPGAAGVQADHRRGRRDARPSARAASAGSSASASGSLLVIEILFQQDLRGLRIERLAARELAPPCARRRPPARGSRLPPNCSARPPARPAGRSGRPAGARSARRGASSRAARRRRRAGARPPAATGCHSFTRRSIAVMRPGWVRATSAGSGARCRARARRRRRRCAASRNRTRVPCRRLAGGPCQACPAWSARRA